MALFVLLVRTVALTIAQVRQKEQGDDEAQGIDETFIDAYVILLLDMFIVFAHLFCSLDSSMVFRQLVVGVSDSIALLCSSLTRIVCLLPISLLARV